MSKYISYSTQQITNADREAVLNSLSGELITRGPIVEKFEEALCKYTASPYCVTFSSATAALHGVMSYIAQEATIEAFMSPVTFVATANSVLYASGTVKFVDIDPSTLNIDTDKLEKALQNRDVTKVTVVVAVDYAGNPCDYDKLLKLKQKYGFILVSDAAHSLGSYYQGVNPCYFSDFTVLSFHPVKTITCGEGGAVLCNNDKENKWLRRFKSSGMERLENSHIYDVVQLGYNYNITEMQAALGLSQLSRITEMVEKREEVANRYLVKLLNAPLLLPSVTPNGRSAWHLFALRIEDFTKRDEVYRRLKLKGIGTAVHYKPVYQFSLYKDLGITGDCPEADKAYKAELSIPCHPGLTKNDINYVVESLKEALK